MTYEEWFLERRELHANVIEEINKTNKWGEVMKYFKFENDDFCPKRK